MAATQALDHDKRVVPLYRYKIVKGVPTYYNDDGRRRQAEVSSEIVAEGLDYEAAMKKLAELRKKHKEALVKGEVTFSMQRQKEAEKELKELIEGKSQGADEMASQLAQLKDRAGHSDKLATELADTKKELDELRQAVADMQAASKTEGGDA